MATLGVIVWWALRGSPDDGDLGHHPQPRAAPPVAVGPATPPDLAPLLDGPVADSDADPGSDLAHGEAEEEAEPPRETVIRRLRRFLFRGVEFDDAPLSEVVAYFTRKMREVGSGDLAGLARIRIEGEPTGPVNFATGQQVSAWGVLGLAAAQAGMEVGIEADGAVVLGPIAGGADRQVERELSGGDLKRLERFVDGAGILTGDAAEGADPFALPNAGDQLEAGLEAYLDALGIQEGRDGDGIDQILESGKVVTVPGTARDHAIADAVAELANKSGWPQIFVESRLVKLLEGGELADQVLPAADVDLLATSFSQQEGATLLSMPSLVTRPGQRGTVFVVRDTPVHQADGTWKTEERGLRLHFDPTVEGERDIHLAGALDISGIEGDAEHETLADAQRFLGDADGSAGRQVTDYATVLRPGEGAALMAFDDGRGGKVLALITPSFISPNGRRYDPPQQVDGE